MKINKKLLKVVPITSFLMSFFFAISPMAFAQTSSACALVTHPKLADLFGYGTCIINQSVIPLLFALAMVVFIWGVIQYVVNGSNEAERKKGREFMIWGLVAIAVMSSIWGIVKILTGTFGVQYVIPQLQQ